jgi:holo-[acyl-carrier protein] synthase
MVSGIGFDLVDLADFGRTLKRSGERFVRRVYTDREIEYCRSQPHPPQSFAARFAAKEATMKALGTAGDEELSWRDFEIVMSPAGHPTIMLHGEAAKRTKALGIRMLHISLSHSRSAAGAVTVVEGSRVNKPRSAKRLSRSDQEMTK